MHHGTDRVMKKLEANPDYDVVEYGCLGSCGECYAMPYALLNGEFVGADTPEELLIKLEGIIKDQEELFRLME
jgi:uncharacterized protein YuzB (UPF0349 family)